MPTPIDFPAGICQTDVTISLRGAVGVGVSPYTFSRYTQDWGGERWELAVHFLPRRMSDIGPLEGFLLNVRHGRIPFRIGDPYKSLPSGTALGNPVVNGVATPGAHTISSRGWIPSIPKQLAAGDYIQIGDCLHRVIADVASDGGGGALIPVAPRIRVAHPDSAPIIVENPRGLFVSDSTVVTFERFVSSRRALPEPLTAVESI